MILHAYCVDRLLWDHMTKVAAVLSNVSQAMNKMSSPSYLSVKELLVSPMWKYIHDCPEQKHSKSPPTVALEGANNYHEQFNIAGNWTIKGRWQCLAAVWLAGRSHVMGSRLIKCQASITARYFRIWSPKYSMSNFWGTSEWPSRSSLLQSCLVLGGH